MGEIITEDVIDVEEMVAELEQYYESAGMKDYYNKVLKDMNEDQIRKCYKDTFLRENDPEGEDQQ